jgi:hypothetical protein
VTDLSVYLAVRVRILSSLALAPLWVVLQLYIVSSSWEVVFSTFLKGFATWRREYSKTHSEGCSVTLGSETRSSLYRRQTLSRSTIIIIASLANVNAETL